MLIQENRLIELRKAKARLYYESMTSSEREREKKAEIVIYSKNKQSPWTLAHGTAEISGTMDLTLRSGTPS